MQDKERAVFSFQSSRSALLWAPGAELLDQQHKTLLFILGCISAASPALGDADVGERQFLLQDLRQWCFGAALCSQLVLGTLDIGVCEAQHPPLLNSMGISPWA